MTTGLLAKTALFPLHLWLPPAHAGAPAAASAILSGLVVKGSFFILVRLWFDVMPGLPGFAAAQLLAALGTGAILFGSVVALRQERLKLLDCIFDAGSDWISLPDISSCVRRVRGDSKVARPWRAAYYRRFPMRLPRRRCSWPSDRSTAGLGHDRITGLRRCRTGPALERPGVRIGGIALMGVQPSGASLAKELLLQDTARTGQWWWASCSRPAECSRPPMSC